jgi:hypothetical protein
MIVGGCFQHYNFHSLNNIPKSVLVPPETKYSLASVILLMENILEELVWIAKIHLGFTSSLIESLNPENRFKLTVWIILFLKLHLDMTSWNYGMSMLIVAAPLLAGTASSTIPPMALLASTMIPPMPTHELLDMPAHVLSTVLKPVGIKNLGHTCYLSTLLQIFFGCTIQKEIDPEETTKKVPKTLRPIFSVEFEAVSETLFNSVVFLKRLLQNMKLSKNTKMPS